MEKIHAKENNHTYKTIFTWFGNLPISTELQRFYYYQGNKIQSAATVFSISQERQQPNPNHRKRFLYPQQKKYKFFILKKEKKNSCEF